MSKAVRKTGGERKDGDFVRRRRDGKEGRRAFPAVRGRVFEKERE